MTTIAWNDNRTPSNSKNLSWNPIFEGRNSWSRWIRERINSKLPRPPNRLLSMPIYSLESRKTSTLSNRKRIRSSEAAVRIGPHYYRAWWNRSCWKCIKRRSRWTSTRCSEKAGKESWGSEHQQIVPLEWTPLRSDCDCNHQILASPDAWRTWSYIAIFQ